MENNNQQAANINAMNDAINNNDNLFEVIYRGGRLDNDYGNYGDDLQHNPHQPHYNIPDDVPFRLIIDVSITKIDTYSCQYFLMLTEVVFHENVTHIGLYAFYKCFNLKYVELPEGLLRLEEGAFEECKSLHEIIIPTSVQYIGRDAFGYCSFLNRVVFAPRTARVELSSGIFRDCINLEFVTLPQNLRAIPNYCFSYCWLLTDIQIPASVELIGEYAFSGSDIYSIKISEEEEFIPGMIMLPPNLQLISRNCFANCKSMANIRIPVSVQQIDEGAFSSSGLRSIEIPENVHHIGLQACRDCLFLERVTIHSTNFNMANNIFVNCPSLTVIMIAPWLWPELFVSMDEHPEFIFRFFKQYQTQILGFECPVVRPLQRLRRR